MRENVIYEQECSYAKETIRKRIIKGRIVIDKRKKFIKEEGKIERKRKQINIKHGS